MVQVMSEDISVIEEAKTEEILGAVVSVGIGVGAGAGVVKEAMLEMREVLPAESVLVIAV